MKKIGLIALALIMALGAMGVGYAMWSDSIAISGTVNTGNVNINVSEFSGTVVYKNIMDDLIVYLPFIGALPTPPANNIQVAYAVAAAGDAEDTVVVTFNNLFPIFNGVPSPTNTLPYKADFTITNAGSIPVKLVISAVKFEGDTILSNVIKVVDDNGVSLEGVQLEPQGSIDGNISITIPEPPNDGTWQGKKGAFSLTITGVQWNEYTAPPQS